MTLILGYKKNNMLYMAGDRFESLDDSSYHKCVRPKITEKSEMLIGAAGNSLLCSAILDLIDLPIPLKSADPMLFISTALVPHFLKELDSLNIKYKYDEAELKDLPEEDKDDFSISILLGINEQLYALDIINGKITGITEFNEIAAVGAGSKEGISAMKGLIGNKRFSGKQILTRAMDIAAESNIYVKPPYDVLEL